MLKLSLKGSIARLARMGACLLVALSLAWGSQAYAAGERWSAEKTAQWYKSNPWPVGFNYVPANAINQLEMWQADSFDPVTIDRELGWARKYRFNTVRVFLHNLLWDQDSEGLLRRMDQFLAIADKHKIKVMFVLLDDVWDPEPRLGKQREPIPFTHNSGWVQAPGKAILGNYDAQQTLKPYVQGVMRRFANDPRVYAWDIYNEPGNDNSSSYPNELKEKKTFSLQMMKLVFAWAREVNPSQPLTVGVWKVDITDKATGEQMPLTLLDPISRLAVEASDFISIHNYNSVGKFSEINRYFSQFGRPVICTEYLARGGNNLADTLPEFAAKDIGAMHWGWVSGKSQTIYPWSSFTKVAFTREPELWHHDFLRPDGSPYSQAEVALVARAVETASTVRTRK